MKQLFYALLLAAFSLPFFLPNGLFAQTCNFITGPNAVCVGDMEAYVISYTGNVASVAWSEQGGTLMPVSNTTALVHWETAGAGSVTATLLDGTGNPLGSCQLAVSVQALPMPEIASDVAECIREGTGKTTGFCEFGTGNFSVVETQGNTYSWTATGSVVSPTANGNEFIVNFGTAGTVTVCVTETTTNGCATEVCETYDVYELPTASFTEVSFGADDPIHICLGQDLTFLGMYDDPDNIPLGVWSWSVTPAGGGNPVATGSQQNFHYVFLQAGTYDVALAVSNCLGCFSNPYTVQVIVDDVEACPIVCPSVVCEGDEVEYCADCDCPLFEWEVIGGTIQNTSPDGSCITVLWNNPPASGFGSVSLVTPGCTGACTSPSVVDVPILPILGEINGPTASCNPNGSLLFSLAGWAGAEYAWSYQITANQSGGTVNAPSSSTNSFYSLVLNNFIGTIVVSVEVEHPIAGCMFAGELTVEVRDYDILGPNQICWGEEPTYQLQQTPPAGSNVSWEIFDANGVVSFGAFNGNPVTFSPFPFPQPGFYRIAVTVQEASGAVVECGPFDFLLNVRPPVPPVEEIIGPTEVCLNTEYVYTATPGAPGTVHWEISSSGTLSSTTGQAVVVTWTSDSPPPELTAYRTLLYGTLECESEPLTLDVSVIVPPPSIDFSGDLSPCADFPDGYVYTATLSGATSYEWTITPPGHGSIESGQGTNEVTIVWHLPLDGLPTTLTLEATVCNTPLTIAHPVTIETGVAPEVVITGNSPVCQFSTGEYAVNVTGTNYEWTFDDGASIQTVITPGPTVTSPPFSTSGTNFVRVKVTGIPPCNAEGEAVFEVTVLENPKPVITTPDSPPCDEEGNPLPFKLHLYVANYNNAATSIEWFCNGGSLGTDPVLVIWHDPNSPCIYSVVVTRIIEGVECAATATYSVNYNCNEGPRCPFELSVDWTLDENPETGCEKALVSGFIPFPFNELVPGSRWVVDDPEGTVVPNPEEIILPAMLNTWEKTFFSKAAFYPFALVAAHISDPTNFCSVRDVIEIPLIADFRWELTCGETEGTFNLFLEDNSERLPDVVNEMTDWIVDGTSYSNSGQVNHTIVAGAASTTIEVCLAIQTKTVYLKPGTGYGCKVCKTITIPAFPTAEFQYNQSQTCEGTPIQFTPTIAPEDVLGYSWDFDDGSGSALSNPSKVYTEPGTYTVSLVVTTKYGCLRSSEEVVGIEENQLDGAITEQMQPCDASAMLCFQQSAGDPAVSFQWSPGGATTMGILVTSNGVYSVTVTDENGCTFSPEPVPVLVTNPFPLGIMGDPTFCAPGSVNLSVLPVGGFTYQWQMGTLIVNSANFSAFVQNPGDYQVTVKAFRNGVLCQETSVTVHADAGPALPVMQYSVLDCDPFLVQVSADQNVDWSLNGAPIGTGQTITWHSGGSFQATVSNEFGCERTAGIFVPGEIELDAFLSGCYCLTAEELANGNILLQGVSGLGSGVTWEWVVNGTVVQSGSGTVQPLPLTTAVLGKIILRVSKQYAAGVICTKESEPFCLEICADECTIPDPTVRAIHCIEDPDGQQKYYVHWDFMQDGETEPCNYTYDNGSDPVEIRDMNTQAVVGYFEWIEDQSISGYWHMEGIMVITDGTSPDQTCWDIPFCQIGTNIECDIATVCPGLSNPPPNQLLNNCPEPVCQMHEFLVEVECDENPFNSISHILTLQLMAMVPPSETFDLMITSITGTIFDPATGLNYVWVPNVFSDASGFLQTTFDIPWYDEIGTDYVCFQVLIKYDVEDPNGPWGDVCLKRFCFDLNEFLPCGEDLSGGVRHYKFLYDCEDADLVTATYNFSLEFPTETTITSFSIENQYGESDSELLTSPNKLSGMVTTDYYRPVFKGNVRVNRPDQSYKDYSIEELLMLCPPSGHRMQGRSDDNESESGLYNKSGLSIQPNPASDLISVKFFTENEKLQEGMTISLVNLMGRELEQFPQAISEGMIQLNTKALADGIYYVVLKSNKGILEVRKLVIHH